MKKLLAILLAVVMCVSFCACGNSLKNDVTGVYEAKNSYLVAAVLEPYMGGTLHKDDTVDCIRTLTLNEDGTGTMVFTPTEDVTFENMEVFDEMSTWTLTWNIDDNYVNITFNEITYVDVNNPFKLTDERREESYTNTYELKGTQLIDVNDGYNYTKINQK